MTFCYALRHDRCMTLKILFKHGLFFVALHKNQFKKKHKVTNNSTYFGSFYACFLIPWSCKDSCVCWGSGADRSSEFAWTIHRGKGEPESKSCRKDWYLEPEQSTRLQQLQQSAQVGVLECRALRRNVWNICDAPCAVSEVMLYWQRFFLTSSWPGF